MSILLAFSILATVTVAVVALWVVILSLEAKLDISCTVVADSQHVLTKERVTTMVIRYPRFIHSEFMTHRWFARNASSSRAIPSSKIRADVLRNMAVPAAWGLNNPGMQSQALANAFRRNLGKVLWCSAGLICVFISKLLDVLGFHKQIVNRVTEPWSYMTVVVTGTYKAYRHFLELRLDTAADPTIRALAYSIRAELNDSVPKTLCLEEWHLPFVSDAERREYTSRVLREISAARCARTSYLNHDRSDPSVPKDLELASKLLSSRPMHASPFEHQVVMSKRKYTKKYSGCLQSEYLITNRALLEEGE